MLKNMKAGLAAGEVKPTRLCRKERFLQMRKNRWRNGDSYQHPKIVARKLGLLKQERVFNKLPKVPTSGIRKGLDRRLAKGRQSHIRNHCVFFAN